MTKLEKLYGMIASAKELGIKLGDDVYRQTAEMEESLIKAEIVPVIRDTIAPVLNKIQRNLTLVVDYQPCSPVNVFISRKGRIYNDGDFVEISLNKKEEPSNGSATVSPAKPEDVGEEPLHKTYGPNKKKREQTAAGTVLRVRRSDGTVLQEKNAAATFVAAIKEAGYEKVRELNLKICKVPLVAGKKDPVYGKSQKEIAKDVYIITHSCTSHKQALLQTISDSIGLGWKIEII